MEFWTNARVHAQALKLIHEMFDRATFGAPENPSHIQLGRVRQASWARASTDFDLMKHELSALASAQLEPHWTMLAFCFLDGPVAKPLRPTSVADFDAAMARALEYKETCDRQQAIDWQIVLPVTLPSKTPIPMPRRFCINER
jgi:hypothetical protein